MNGISFEDGMKILDLARQNMQAKPGEEAPAAEPHQSVLSDAQAHAFQLMMLITGQDGSTVGRGALRDHPIEGAGNGVRQVDRQVGGPDGPGDAQAVQPQWNPDPGTDSRPGTQGPLNGGQEGSADGQLNQAPGTTGP